MSKTSTSIITPPFRASYPNLFKARKNELNGKDEFSVVALFPPGSNLDALKKAARDAIVAKWGPDEKKWPKTHDGKSRLRTPFRLQDEKEKEHEETGEKFMPPGYEKGGIFLNLRSTNRPGVVAADRDPTTGKARVVTEPSEIYAGCWLRASVSVYAYDQKGNCGVAFGLNNIQKYKDDEPLGGRAAPEAEFAPIEEAAGAESSAADIFG